MTREEMDFPKTWEEYEEHYGFNDYKEVYTNGSRLILSFRVKQWLDHLEQEPCDNCEYLDGDGCRLLFEQIEYGKASNDCPCEDAISRQAAIDAMYNMHMNGKEGVLHDLKTETGSDAFFAETIADAVEALEELPPVNPQPCEDCISRIQAIKAMDELENEDIEAYGCLIPEGFDGERARQAICMLPSIQPQPKTGHWIKISPAGIYECSECGQNVMTSDICAYKFCHGCGEKMQEVKYERKND